ASTPLVFVNAPASPDIYPLSLHDALPISPERPGWSLCWWKDAVIEARCVAAARAGLGHVPLAADLQRDPQGRDGAGRAERAQARSEEHTPELPPPTKLLCRLLLSKKTPPH